MTRFRRMTFGPGSLVLAGILAVTCRRFEVDSRVHGRGSRGGTGGDSGRSGAASRGGSDEASGNGPGGGGVGAESGSGGSAGEGGASVGRGGGGSSGESGAGDGGDAGDGSRPEPGILGAVRVIVNGDAKCGGSLITNDWVLTADQCADETIDHRHLQVGFGMDSNRFQQTRQVLEMRRFIHNDGTTPNRGHDLMLLGVEEPFEIDAQTSGYHRRLWAHGPEQLLQPHRCVGWDLRVSEESDITKLHEESLTPFAFDPDTSNGRRPAGNRIWWLNGNAGQMQGVLPMPADVGSACFLTVNGSIYQSTVHSGNPPERVNGGDNRGGFEAYSVALGDSAIHEWLASALFESVVEDLPDQPLGGTLVGDPAVCSLTSGRIELFGQMGDGAIGWYTWDAGDRTWTHRSSFPPPADDFFLPGVAPGAYCTSAGGIELFATGLSGGVWWRRMAPSGEWRGQWFRLPGDDATLVSGVSATGVLPDHFYVFARDDGGDLRFAEYDDRWVGPWVNVGGPVDGTPAALMSQAGRIDVFTRTLVSLTQHRRMQNGAWEEPSVLTGDTVTDPAVVSWGHSHLDVIARTGWGVLGHVLYDLDWTGHLISAGITGITMPPGNPAAVAPRPGTTHIFVREQQRGKIWHGTWPRKPRSDQIVTPRTPEASASKP